MAKQEENVKDDGGVEASVVNKPAHYQGLPHDLQVVDIMEAVCPHDAHTATALIYIMRAGKKEGSTYDEDIAKAVWWLKRGVKFRGGHPELDTSDV